MSMKMKKQVKQLLADDTSQGTDITSLKTTVGNSSGGLVKDMTDAKAAIGTDDTTAGSLKKRCKDIETAIGDEDTSGTILYRIKALETPANNSGGGDS